MSDTSRYSFDSEEIIPQRWEPAQGTYGVYVLLEPGTFDLAISKIDTWFDGREEVFLVDSGTTAKTEEHYLMLEWDGYLIDPLFLKILDHDNRVLDYTPYSYATGDEEEGA